MRALTLRPQWAHAIAWHGKRIENRSKPWPRTVPIGERFALHAGMLRKGPWWLEVVDASRGTVPVADGPAVVAYRPPGAPLMPRTDQNRWVMQERAIVGCASVARCVRPECGVQGWPPFGDPSAAFWWLLEAVAVFDHAIPVPRGQLGLWHLDDETERLVKIADVAARFDEGAPCSGPQGDPLRRSSP